MAVFAFTQANVARFLGLQPRKSGGADEIKAAAAMTTAYASGWETSWVPCEHYRSGRLFLTWVLADATSMQIQIDTSDDGGTTAFPEHDVPTPTLGATTADTLEITYTAADYTTTGLIPIRLDLSDVLHFKVRAKKTGGAGSSTLALSFMGGI